MATTNKKSDREIANDKAKRMMQGVATWCRFCADYLNINLKLFQKILLYMMFYSNYLCYIASRG